MRVLGHSLVQLNSDTYKMMIFQKTKCLCKIFKNTTKQSHSTFGAQLRFRGRPGNNNGVVVSRIYLFCGMAGFATTTGHYEVRLRDYGVTLSRWSKRATKTTTLPTYGLLTTFLWHDTTTNHHYSRRSLEVSDPRLLESLWQTEIYCSLTCFSLGIWVCHYH